MNQEFFADLWSTLVDHVPENKRKDLAHNYINLLTDYDVPAATIEAMMGIDSHLDTAIEYSIDDASWEDEEEIVYDEEDEWNDED